MPGAADRLEGYGLLTVIEPKHVVVVVRPVAAALPDGLAQHLWRLHLRIAFGATATTCGVAEHAVQRESARMPEHHAWRFVLEMKQIEDVPQIAMIRRF
jgi:hypothetical protein